MADDERQDAEGTPPPEDGGDLAASGAAGEPSDGAADEAAAAPPADGGEVAASGAAGEPSEGAGDDADAPAEPEPVAAAESEPEPAPADTPTEPTGEAEAVAPEPQAAGAEGAEVPGGEPGPAEAGAEGVEPPAATADPSESPAAGEEPEAEAPQRPERPRREAGGAEAPREDVVPGAHLEPDLVLEQDRAAGEDDEFARYREPDADAATEQAADVAEEAAPRPRTAIELAADARYKATGKRKTAVARVVVKPGNGTYKVNGRPLEQFFPRPTLQRNVRAPLEAVGYDTRMDVVARLHGGGVSSQADALRHGIARALVEADPNLRTEMKRRGFLTRDAREKERKKAGLKKARKRPQFSKR